MTHSIDGKNIFYWRAECQEIAERFVEYAAHKAGCHSQDGSHQHITMATGLDPRVVCMEAPCSCGLLIILGVLMPTMEWSIQCPDKPLRMPTRRTQCVYVHEIDCYAATVRSGIPECHKPHRVPMAGRVPKAD